MQLHFSVCNKYRLTYNAEIATETWRYPPSEVVFVTSLMHVNVNMSELEPPPPLASVTYCWTCYTTKHAFSILFESLSGHTILIFFGTSFKTYILRLIIPLVSQLARSFTPVIILHVAGLNLFRSQQIALSLYWPHPLLLSGQNILHFTFVFNETYWRQPLPARP